MAIDLHIHSSFSSDGEYSPGELVKMAKDAGLEAIAITDHDNVKGVEEALYWGGIWGVEVVPGVELYAEHRGRWLHILGYFIDIHNKTLNKLGEKIIQDRLLGVDLQIEKLQEAGFYLNKEAVLKEAAGDSPLYSAYSTAIFADARNMDNPLIRDYLHTGDYIIQFCKDFMVQGKQAYIHQYSPEAVDVIQVIRDSAGIPILAHPGSSLEPGDDYLLDELLEHGLRGLEVYTSQHHEQQEKHYQEYCRRHKLIFTCGSDFHGKLKPHVKMGQIKNNSYQVLKILKECRC